MHDILVHARCSMPILSLACGILDSLNSKFSLAWRRTLPLDQMTVHNGSPMSEGASKSSVTHIDQVRPEVILLSALIIASKYLDDEQAPTAHYAHVWASNRWSCRMINVTEQCIMANLQYRILHLANVETLKEAEQDMERTGYFARRNSGVLDYAGNEMQIQETNASQQCASGFKKSNKTFSSNKRFDNRPVSGTLGLGIH